VVIDESPLGLWVDALAARAKPELDASERRAFEAALAVDPRVAGEFAWLPWAAVGVGPGLEALRRMRRAAWAKRLSRDWASNLMWEEHDDQRELREAVEAFASMLAPSRLASLWPLARAELSSGCEPAHAKAKGALDRGWGDAQARAALFCALDELDVAEGDEEARAAWALARLDRLELRASVGEGESGRSEGRRL
jgi:hypothetical protein